MNRKNGTESNKYKLLEAVPVMPEMIDIEGIQKEVPSLGKMAFYTLAGLSPSLPLCQEGRKISFVSAEAKEKALEEYRTNKRIHFKEFN